MAEHRMRGALHLVTDRALCGPRGLEAVVAAAVAGGVTHVQLREKQAPAGDFLALARALHAWLRAARVPLIINDSLEVAVACGAEGLHLGQQDLPVAEARRRLPLALIGLSIETPRQLEQAEREGCPCDYYGASPVFATSTKPDAATALGLEGLARLRTLTRRPLIAIGGIDARNAAAVCAAGADGLAVVSAICAAPDPAQAASQLRDAMAAAGDP